MNHVNGLVLSGMLFVSGVMTQAVMTQVAAAGQAQPANTVMLQGRVADMLGEPVVAAQLEVTLWDGPQTAVARGRTDGEGLFRIRAPRVPVGDYLRVVAHAEGRSVVVVGVISAEQPILITLHDAAELRGTLRNVAGEPVANTKVFARSNEHSLHGAECEATTDALGDFVLPNVAVGPTMVGAFVVGQGLMQAHLCVREDAKVQLVPTPGPQTSIRVKLEGLPAGATRRVLVDLEGSGGVPRMVLPPDMRLLEFVDNECLVEHLPDWRFRLHTYRAGYTVAPMSSALKSGKGPHRVTLKVTPPPPDETTVSVVVRDALGKPVSGVAIWLLAFPANVRVKAHSDVEGRVSLRSPLGKGSEAMLASADEAWVIDREVREHHSGAQTQSIVVDPDQAVELRLIPACRIAGVVRLPNGKPAPFVEVELCEASSPPPRRGGVVAWSPVARSMTGADGTFRIHDGVARKNPVRLQVTGPSGSATSDSIVIREPGTQVTDCELQLLAAGVVAGVVRDPDGRLAVGEVVRVTPSDRRRYEETVTDKLGRYRFAGVRNGRASVHVMRDGHVADGGTAVVVVEGETQELDLKAPAQVR